MSVRIPFHLHDTHLVHLALVGDVRPAWRCVRMCGACGGERIETD